MRSTLVLRRFSKQHQLRGATRTRDEQKAARCRRQDDAGDSAPSTAACRLPSELRRCCSVRRYKASVAFDSTCRDLIKSATLCFERSSCSGRTRPAATCSGPWQRSIEACRWVAMRAAHRRGTSKAINFRVDCGVPRAHEHIRRVLDGRASAAWCRCGLRPSGDAASHPCDAPRRRRRRCLQV